MQSVSVNQECSAAPEVVWTLMTDMDTWVGTVEAIELVERLDDNEGFGLGTRWRETRTMFGRTATEVMEVTEYEEGKRYVTLAESHGAKYRSEMTVEAAGEGSRLSMSFSSEPQTFMTKVMAATVGRLFMSSTRKAIAKDLEDIAAVAEKSSAGD